MTETLNISKVRNLAKRVRAGAADLGIPMLHSQALEVVSWAHGYHNWHAFSSSLRKNDNSWKLFTLSLFDTGPESRGSTRVLVAQGTVLAKSFDEACTAMLEANTSSYQFEGEPAVKKKSQANFNVPGPAVIAYWIGTSPIEVNEWQGFLQKHALFKESSPALTEDTFYQSIADTVAYFSKSEQWRVTFMNQVSMYFNLEIPRLLEILD